MRIIPLVDILVREKYILVDSGALHFQDYGIGEHLYNAPSYLDLDRNKIMQEIANVQGGQNILKLPNAYTLPCVTEEIEAFKVFVTKKLDHLGPSETDADQKSQSTLLDLESEISALKTSSEVRELRESENYDLLLDCVKLIARVTDSKTDLNFQLGIRDRDRKYDSDADERLVATLYDQRLCGRDFSILTTDRDISNILENSIRIMGDRYMLPVNSAFRRTFLENPARIYRYLNKDKAFACFIFRPKPGDHYLPNAETAQLISQAASIMAKLAAKII